MNPTPDKSAPPTRIAFLDYLRIFAFVTVLVDHKFYGYLQALTTDPALHATPRLVAGWLLTLTDGGGAGVVVFFLVSGYIITHVLQTERAAEFLVRRTFRIYPLYIVAVLAQWVPLALQSAAPSPITLLSQLLLVGDAFGTPYALGGVEWTLRVEALFYVFMAALRALGLLTTRRRFLPAILVASTLLCAALAPIPSGEIWARGYLTIYGPFLLLGSVFYLAEKKAAGLVFLSLFSGVVFYQYSTLIARFQPRWLESHFAVLGFLIFVVAWIVRTRVTAAPWVLLLSDLTYAVYLFHNWFFEYAKQGLAWLGVTLLNADLQALIVLLLVCHAMVRYVEKPCIRRGRALSKTMARASRA